MSEQNKQKQYGNKDIIRNLIFAIVLIMVILFCFYTIFMGYFRMSFGKYLFFSFLSAVGLYWCLRKLYYYYAYCLYVDTTDENILGINIYKKKRGELKFNEIKEVKIRKKSGINLKDIHGNQLTILYRDGFIPLVNEILEKSENCTKTFIDYSIRRKLYEFSDIKTIKTRLHESDIKPHESDIQPQKPKQYGDVNIDRAIFLYQRLTIVLNLVIIFCFYTIFTGYSRMSSPKYLFFSLLSAVVIYWCSRIIYRYFVYCSYVETTEEDILGKNAYNMKNGTIKFNEIKEISVKKRSGIHLKDIHGNKLAIPYRDKFTPLLNEILEKSENCTKTFMDYSIKNKLYKLSDTDTYKLNTKHQKADIKTHDSNIKPHESDTKTHELNIKSHESAIESLKPRLYSHLDRYRDTESPRYYIFMTVVGIIFIIVGFYAIITGYYQVSFQEYLFIFLLMGGNICWFSWMIFYSHTRCLFVETTEEKMVGMNGYKEKKGELKFSEIKEIWITKKILGIHLKDIHGNQLCISFNDGLIPLLQEILEKSENCTKIDIDYDYFIKKNLSPDLLSAIKPILDKRLAELKEKIEH